MDIFEKKLGKMRIVFLWKEKKKKMTLLGINTIEMTMTFAHNKTAELCKTFMPRRHEIANNVDTLLYPTQIYSHSFFDAVNPNKEFEKWEQWRLQTLQPFSKEWKHLFC